MRVALIGARGYVGAAVRSRLIAEGHHVTQLLRNPAAADSGDPRVVTVAGDALTADGLERLVVGAEAVIHALGLGGRGDGTETTVFSDSVRLTLDAMQRHGVPRIVCLSNVGAGGSGGAFANRLVIPLFIGWLRPIIADKDRMEMVLADSDREWVSVRLPNVVDGPEAATVANGDGRGLKHRINRDAAAAFLASQLTSDEHLRTAVCVANR